jgi:hypothetical protein
MRHVAPSCSNSLLPCSLAVHSFPLKRVSNCKLLLSCHTSHVYSQCVQKKDLTPLEHDSIRFLIHPINWIYFAPFCRLRHLHGNTASPAATLACIPR